MLSYQHAYHAGGPADVHKHMVLAELLALLTAKSRGISYVETHAGRGLYDLAGPEAAKTGEAAFGIARLRPDPASPFAKAMSAVWSAHGPMAYPGSPMIAAQLLRGQDRMTLMELHPAENGALRLALRGHAASIHRRDGYEGVLALAPFKPRKGLVLVDPSYEVKTEYEKAAEFVRRLVAKWPEATVLIWYPVLSAGRHADLLEGLRPLGPDADEVRFVSKPARGMTGSGLVLVNAPYGAEKTFARVHEASGRILTPATGLPKLTRSR